MTGSFFIVLDVGSSQKSVWVYTSIPEYLRCSILCDYPSGELGVSTDKDSHSISSEGA